MNFESPSKKICDIPKLEIVPLLTRILKEHQSWGVGIPPVPGYESELGNFLNAETFRRKGDKFPHRESKILNLRYSPVTQPTFDYAWDEWADLVSPLCDHIMDHYGYEKGQIIKVQLCNLPSRSMVYPHIDVWPACFITNRVHIPIQSRDGVVFRSKKNKEDEWSTFTMPVGEAHEINNIWIHSVRNDSFIDRFHLIIDIWDGETRPDPDQKREGIQEIVERYKTNVQEIIDHYLSEGIDSF